MNKYKVSLVKRFKVVVEAKDRAELEEMLFESSDEIATDECLDYTDWDVIAEWAIADEEEV